MINSNKIFEKAYAENFAVGAFNVYNMESIQAVTEACNELNSPVILQVSDGTIKYAGLNCIAKLVESISYELNIPLVLHLDHGRSFEICKSCVDSGFTSVMIDGSHLNFDKNVKITKKVVNYAHKFGVSVEAELGRLAGNEELIKVSDNEMCYTNPLEAKKFVEFTEVDSLAVAIGTSHGAYKLKTVSGLNFEILKKISELLPNFPIVLHGASSIPKKICNEINSYGGKLGITNGISENDLKQAAKMAVCKINIDSDLRLATTAAIRKYLSDSPENFDPRNYLSKAKICMKNLVKYKIKNILGSENKA